jgi:uncharacterized zinc-type alcohol dehydrogenase-like protein
MKVRGYAAMQAKAALALDIKYSGICHSDIHQAREEWGPAIFPMVPGHEIAGIVTQVGASVTKFKVGDRIGVGVFVDSCRKCPSCLKGLQQYCIEGMTGTYNQLERDGKTPAMGGYSNVMVINEDYAVSIPDNLPLDGVAPLLCAGITLYSPIKHWNTGPGKKVAVMGLGGLGHMGVKFAAALGADVTVFSHSPGKEADAKAMGAHHFVSTKEEGFSKKYFKHFDLILNTVTLVVIGLPGKPYAVEVGALLPARRSLSGSMIGGIPEMQEMLNFCGKHNIVSDIEVIKADYINSAYERTVASDVKYRFVIDATTF